MSDDDDYDTTCPLCVEEMDLSDQNFLPCPCGYKVCMWCWHHIRENLNGLCPACRTPYNSDPHAFSAVDREDVVKLKKEKKQKEKQEKKVGERIVSAAPGVKPSGSALMDRKHLHNYRVVQRNLVYVIGVPASYASEENLRRPEFFGQYGKIGKVVIHRNPASAHTTVSVYVTFVYKEDAKASIQSLDGHWLDQQHILRASFGTTKYCNNFIRGVPCNNPECVYLHDLGEDDDRFTKEEIQAGHSKIPPVPGKDQSLVTGNGGPSGTGKRPNGEPILPPPVFIQDNYPSLAASNSSSYNTSSTSSAPPGVGLPAAGSAGAAMAASSLGGGIGVGIVTGRPAAASRSGTATWGNPNTLAAITGNAPVDTTAGEKRSQSGTPVVSGGLIPISMIRLGDDEDGSRPHELKVGPPTPRTPALAAPTASASANPNQNQSSSNAPTAILKRSASTASASGAPGLEATSQVTSQAPPVPAPAPVPVVKVKPKSAKEIAAEKKAALAAAKAAASAPAPAATTAGAEAATSGEAEAKPVGPAPTPKLSARQQMLQNRADKAAAKAAEKAEKAERTALAAAAAAGAALPPPPALTIVPPADTSSSASHPSSVGSGAIGGDVSPHTLGPATAGKVSAIIRRPESKTKLNAMASSPTNTETPEMPALMLPASTSQTILFWNDLSPSVARSSRFNGLGANAVFPVPVSSLSCSVWANILRASNEDLSVNPYGQLTTPMCELLDLTLPPSDALLSATPCWPRPMSYYSSGMSTDGTTFTPAGKHNHQRSVADMAQLPPLPPLPPPSLQPRSDPVFQRGRLSPSPPILTPTGLPGPATSAGAVGATPAMPMPALVHPPRSGKGNGEPAREPREEGSVERFARNGRAAIAAERAAQAQAAQAAQAQAAAASGSGASTPLSPPPGVGPPSSVVAASPSASSASAGGSPVPAAGTSMNALRQLFPGVKMSVSQGGK